ncbi:hypothetical protein ABKS89_13625 [Pseudomonas sp. LABIM340]|uniref:hypothetical protein n=1 Tax=Pseudomonas sp. LABIM340 TaxID=3156585 RepID=UPI0032AEC684
MSALDFLTERGFAARISGNKVSISPGSRLTEEVRQYVRRHRLELLAELGSMDGKTRRMHWAITLGGKPLCTMITPPLTLEEALIEARWRWPGAEITE